MAVNRLVILSVFLIATLLASPLFNVGFTSAMHNSNPEKARAWFFPSADPVPIFPGDSPSLLTLWVVETKGSGIDYIDRVEVVMQGPPYPYVLGGAEVYAFDNDTNTWSLVSGTGTGDWQVTSLLDGGTVIGFRIDWVGGAGTQLNNYTGAVGDVNAFEVLVVKLIVNGYANPSEALVGTTNTWIVTTRWDSGDSLIMYIPHTVDNSPPDVQLTPSTASLLSAPVINTLLFDFNVTATDNVFTSGVNASEYGSFITNGSIVNVTAIGSPNDINTFTSWNVYVNFWINASLKRDFLAGGTNYGPFDFEPNSRPPPAPDRSAFNGYVTGNTFTDAQNESIPIAESTEGEYGYIWLILAIFIQADLIPTGTSALDSNYTYVDLMLYDPSTGVFYANVNLGLAVRVGGGGPLTLGGAAGLLQSADLTFVVWAADGTLDHHKDWNMSDGNPALLNDYNDTVSADVGGARNWYNERLFIWTAQLDLNKAPVVAQLNNVGFAVFPNGFIHAPEPGPVIAPGTFPNHINYRTAFFNFTWMWDPLYGADPTALEWNITISRWDGTNWITVISDTLPASPAVSTYTYLFDIIQFGTGNYSIHLYLRDLGGVGAPGEGFLFVAGQEVRWEFNVTYFLVVYINNNPQSLWANGPGMWEEFYQDETVFISIQTFGTKKDGSPLNWADYDVNITVWLQTGAPPAVGTAAVYMANMDNPTSTTPTYAWWNFTVDVLNDLGGVVGVYNVTASWVNTTASPQFQVDNNFNIPLPPPNEESTFIVKARIFLHFWVYDDLYSTGETATFFAHVANINWPAPGSNVPGALVAYDVFRDDNGLPVATGFGVSNANGFVVPSLFGEIVFGTEIGDDWAPGLYNVNATAYYNQSPGFWFDPAIPGWVQVFAVSTDSASDQFEVWVFRDENVTQGFDDLFTALNGLSDDVSSLADSLNDVLDVLNNNVLPTLSDIMDQLSGLSTTIADLNAAVSDLQGAVADLQDTVAALSDIQAALDSLASQVSGISNTLSDLQNAVDNVAAAVDAVQGSLDDLAGQVAAIADSMGQLMNDVDGLSSDVSSIMNAVSNLQSTVDDLSAAVEDVQGSLDEISSALDGLSSDVGQGFDNLEQALGDLETSLSDKIDVAAGDLNSMSMIQMVLVIIVLAVSALTAFKVFKA